MGRVRIGWVSEGGGGGGGGETPGGAGRCPAGERGAAVAPPRPRPRGTSWIRRPGRQGTPRSSRRRCWRGGPGPRWAGRPPRRRRRSGGGPPRRWGAGGGGGGGG